VLKHVKKVFIEGYTGIIDLSSSVIAEVIKNKDVAIISRKDIEENNARVLFKSVKEGDVALLVAGDPLVATTHISIVIEAFKQGIEFEIIPGISIIPNALTLSGLMIYKIGKIATVVYPKEGIVYEYPYDIIKDNDKRNLHTVLLLDMDVEKNVFMKAYEALEILFEIERRRCEKVIRPNRYGVVVAALGSVNQVICFGELSFLREIKISQVPQTLIITSPKLHFMEEEALMVMNHEFCNARQ